MTTAVKSDTRLEIVTRQIKIKGIRPIMFGRYAGDNKTKLTWDQTIYLIPGTNILCLPALNIASAFSAQNTESYPKRLRDKRMYRGIANACRSFISFSGPPEHPEYIPFKRDGEVIRVGKFGDSNEPESGLYLSRHVARLKDGIPNPVERATLPMPWELEFTLEIMPNKEIKEQEIKNLMVEGGQAIGLGTYRGVFGKFAVESWE